MSSTVDLRGDMHEGEADGCGSCSGSCLSSLCAYMLVGVLCQKYTGTSVGLQIVAVYLLGMLIGKLTSHIWKGEFRRPATAAAGLIITGIPMALCALAGLWEGLQVYLEVMERSGPGWGRADIANYTYPPIAAYMNCILLLVLALGWLMTSLGAYRHQLRGDRL